MVVYECIGWKRDVGVCGWMGVHLILHNYLITFQ